MLHLYFGKSAERLREEMETLHNTTRLYPEMAAYFWQSCSVSETQGAWDGRLSHSMT